MIVTVFNEEIEFSKREEKIFKDNNLNLTPAFMKMMLLSFGINDFSLQKTPEERHDVCVDAIKDYTNVVIDTLSYAEREGII